MTRLGGLARLWPLLAIMFFVPAMNLAGIPPLSGFFGKVGLASAAIDVGTPTALVLVAGTMVTSLLTLYAIAKAWSLAFWRTPEEAHQVREERHARHGTHGDTTHPHEGTDRDLHQRLLDDDLPRRRPRTMVGATLAMLTVSLGLSVVAGPLYAYADRAAADLVERDPYIRAVLPEELR